MHDTKCTVHAAKQKHFKVNQESILEIIAEPADRGSLDQILRRAGWKSETCNSLAAAQPLLPEASVVMCDEELPDGNWREVLTQLESLPMNPALIVASHLADEHLWSEVLNLGGYDLLLEPFRADEVLRTVETACDSISGKQKAGEGAIY
jgi:DNA-binding NtrC family response regulator